jgi:CRP-like cAMP-binding protein
MALFDQFTPIPRNRLLAALPPEDLAWVRPRLERVELPVRHTLYAAHEPITAVYFPETGWVSMLATLENGDAAEVGLVGREGMVGLPLLLGTDRAPFEAMTQAGSTVLRLDAAAFREDLEARPGLRTLLLRYAMAFNVQVSQTAACNGRHHIEDRLARWLLMAHDRAEGNEFPMTHEFLSMMLGVRRAGISLAAGVLQKAGLIHYTAGRMEVTDRPGLEAASCECYNLVRHEFGRLFEHRPSA